jgi:hypothetical protein
MPFLYSLPIQDALKRKHIHLKRLSHSLSTLKNKETIGTKIDFFIVGYYLKKSVFPTKAIFPPFTFPTKAELLFIFLTKK